SSLSLPQHKPITRWDADLARAREAHREKNWGDVHRLCSKVIDMADDWNAVEQAHLRLALAEQKRCGIDGGRRAFQHGTEDCPSSDTLLLAWALMESKIHSARARKTAWALLRRAVALNPKKHSKVLKWTMFNRDLDWVEAAGGAAVQAVRSALSPAPAAAAVAAAGARTSGSNGNAERREKASTSRAEAKRETEIATELQTLCHGNEALLREQEGQGTRAEAGGNAAESHSCTPSFPSSSFPHECSILLGTVRQVSRVGRRAGESRERCGGGSARPQRHLAARVHNVQGVRPGACPHRCRSLSASDSSH
ncbi:unnamed protein product, partial [Hapterophycus canaliculatus]